MLLIPEYQHSYGGITISDAATVPSRGARNPYLRFCCCLNDLFITEGEVSQSDEVGSAESDASFFSDAVVICIQTLIPNHNYRSSAVRCSPSFFSISLRTAGKLSAEIHF